MRLDVVSKAVRGATRFSAQCQGQQFRAAHTKAAVRAALAVEAQQRNGRFASLLPVAAAMALVGAAGVASMDDGSAAKCEARPSL